MQEFTTAGRDQGGEGLAGIVVGGMSQDWSKLAGPWVGGSARGEDCTVRRLWGLTIPQSKSGCGNSMALGLGQVAEFFQS